MTNGTMFVGDDVVTTTKWVGAQGWPATALTDIASECLMTRATEGWTDEKSSFHRYLMTKDVTGGGVAAGWWVGVTVFPHEKEIYIVFPEELPPEYRYQFPTELAVAGSA